MASSLVFGLTWAVTFVWLNASSLFSSWGRVHALVDESRKTHQPACEAFVRDLRLAGPVVAGPEAARRLLAILEKHPGSDLAGRTVQGMLVEDRSLDSSRMPARLAAELIRLEPFCALPDFYEAWRRLLLRSEGLNLSPADRQRLVELGLKFVRSESAGPSRAASVFFQVATLQSLSDKGWVSLPRRELRRLNRMAGQLREELQAHDRSPSSAPESPLRTIRLELERTRVLREQISGLANQARPPAQASVSSSPGV